MTREEDMLDLAQRIIAKEPGFVEPYGRNSFYSARDWEIAAQYAIDGDTTDLVHMDRIEQVWLRFNEWMRRDPKNREDVDFDDWLEWQT